ncbi:3-hydroxyacyl-CoA dehydrogenase NAD-binding domain-containing protein [Endozoicomonadaceae bacterium StTr2]
MAEVNLRADAGVALISVTNPPVNAISRNVRSGLLAAIEQVQQDDEIRVAIIYCTGRTFMAGADIKEFGLPAQPPSLPEVTAAIAASKKPLIALIHGQALGGGLEIALACAARLTTKDARLGFPEVKLGLIPGAGGSQRLPALIGMEKALPMITSGKPVNASEALSLGLVDKVLEADHQEAWLAEARKYAMGIVTSVVQDEPSVTPVQASQTSDEVLDSWRLKLTRRYPGQPAPAAALEAMVVGEREGIEQGLQAERSAFLELRESPQARALQHLFFAEKKAAKIPQHAQSEVKPVRCIAVVGAGTMGSGIALSFATADLKVLLLDNSEAALQRGQENIEAGLAKGVKRGVFSQEQADAIRAKIEPVTDRCRLGEVDMVIEAVFEDMQIKQQLFLDCQQYCRSDVIWATNTSYLDINHIAEVVDHPENMLGVHFFSPANIMPLVEVVRADKTHPGVLAAVMVLLKQMGKTSVVSGVCHGFIGNRMYQCYQREAGLLLLEGATPQQIDHALTAFGMAMGPFSVADMSGLDISYRMRKALPDTAYEKQAFLVHDRLVETNRMGRKTERGFYNYQLSNTREDDPEVLELIQGIAREQGFAPGRVSDDEIVDRCILAMVNEAGHILDESIAARSSDIDVVLTSGYGFPRVLGGPMFYARSRGLVSCLKQIESYSQQYGSRWWQPSNILKTAAQSGCWPD